MVLGSELKHSVGLASFLPAILVAGALPCASYAQDVQDVARDAAPRADEIIVTGVSDRSLAQVPRSTQVITALDIELLPSNNLIDLLAREANLTLRSTSGNEKFSGVDIRGQGDTYVSNVLVMIDGFAINAADLSGADFASLPLDQIERIEVIRGANTVRYGSGAVAGVINIITRKPEDGVQANVRARAGSYETVSAGQGVAWSNGIASFGADINYFDTAGYRDNSGLEKKDILLKGGIRPVEWFDSNLTISHHLDTYGLPGPLSYADVVNGVVEPTDTNFPYDGGTTDDERVRLDLAIGTAATGIVDIVAATRDRENEFRLGVDPNGPDPDNAPFDVIREDADELQAQYSYDFSTGTLEHAVYAGVYLNQRDYAREPLEADFNDFRNTGELDERAWFVAADIRLTNQLLLSAGYRQDRFENDWEQAQYQADALCDDWQYIGNVRFCNDPGGARPGWEPQQSNLETWRNDATELGLVYDFDESTSIFLSYATSFRNPNVDELVFAAPDLSPQTGTHWDVGVRQQWSVVEANLAFFYNRTDDEILYGVDPNTNTQINRNADAPVDRTGGELDVRWQMIESLTLTANAGYTDAEFTATGKTMPLVPEWTAAATAMWTPLDNWFATAAWNYVGERFQGDDFANSDPELPSYDIVDVRLSYDRDSVLLYAGVNNLFDELYVTSAYSNAGYPMPDRNLYAGVEYRL